MTTKRFFGTLFVLLLLAIIGSAILTDHVACNRGVKGRESLIALREGFLASAHGRYVKANRQHNPALAAEERKEGDGLYMFARRITVRPPNCSGVFPTR